MEKQKESWKPKIGGKFYWIGSGHILKGVHKDIWEGSPANESLYSQRGVYKSKKEADWIYKSFNGHY